MKIKDLKYLLAYLIPLSALIGIIFKSYWSFATGILAFIIVPLIELTNKPKVHQNEDENVYRKRSNVFFDVLLYTNIPIVYGLLLLTIVAWMSGLNWWENLGLTVNIGIVLATTGINVAHEIGHRKGFWNKIAAASLLVPSFYGHFTLEHNYGHHKNVGKPNDPTTARINISLYSYIFSVVPKVYLNAWKISFMKMQEKGKSKWHWKNGLIWITVCQFLLFSGIAVIGGWKILALYITAAILSFSLLESINYIEHYGLVRKKLPSGKYERVSVQHSWNTDHALGRILLYELTRHSDHHMDERKKYQLLKNDKNYPQLVFGYPGSIILALIPKLWFNKMNAQLKLHNT